MPSNNSWNGKWTGDSTFYARTRSLSKDKAAAVLKNGHYSYNFGDGWRARIDVKSVTSAERKAIDKNTKGFCGYDWMINSIIKHGDIYADEPKVKIYADMSQLEAEGII